MDVDLEAVLGANRLGKRRKTRVVDLGHRAAILANEVAVRGRRHVVSRRPVTEVDVFDDA